MDRKLHEPLEQHIHEELVNKINQVVIGIKLNHIDISDSSAIEYAKIMEAIKNHPSPTWLEIVELLERIMFEMNSCTKPYRMR